MLILLMTLLMMLMLLDVPSEVVMDGTVRYRKTIPF